MESTSSWPDFEAKLRAELGLPPMEAPVARAIAPEATVAAPQHEAEHEEEFEYEAGD